MYAALGQGACWAVRWCRWTRADRYGFALSFELLAVAGRYSSRKGTYGLITEQWHACQQHSAKVACWAVSWCQQTQRGQRWRLHGQWSDWLWPVGTAAVRDGWGLQLLGEGEGLCLQLCVLVSGVRWFWQ